MWAARLLKKSTSAIAFFTEQLIAAGVDPRIAEADACRIEHIISDESFSRLKEAAHTRPRINRIRQAILPR